MSKTFTIIYYQDPSHGWGKVKRQVLQNLGIEDNISSYSYQFKDNVYLEEDCDLDRLCQRLNQDGVVVKFVEKLTDRESKIRSYEPFKPEKTL